MKKLFALAAALSILMVSGCSTNKSALEAAESYLKAAVIAAEATVGLSVAEENLVGCIVGSCVRDVATTTKAVVVDVRVNDRFTVIPAVDVNLEACAPLLKDGFPSVITPALEKKIKRYVASLLPLAILAADEIVDGTDIPQSSKDLSEAITNYIGNMAVPIINSLSDWNGHIHFPEVGVDYKPVPEKDVTPAPAPIVVPDVAPIVVPDVVTDVAPADVVE